MVADRDLLTLAEAKEAINLTSSNTNQDDEIARFVTGLSFRIDEMCGPVVIQTFTNEVHDGGRHSITPHNTPVSSVDTVVEYSGTSSTTLTAETISTAPGNAYLLDQGDGPHNVEIRRRAGKGDATFPDGRRNIQITYDAGRAASTGDVDALFKLAAGAILRRLWQREGSAWARPDDPFGEGGMSVGFFKAVDPMINELLSDELKPDALGVWVL